jgi:hypothetical protein
MSEKTNIQHKHNIDRCIVVFSDKNIEDKLGLVYSGNICSLLHL